MSCSFIIIIVIISFHIKNNFLRNGKVFIKINYLIINNLTKISNFFNHLTMNSFIIININFLIITIIIKNIINNFINFLIHIQIPNFHLHYHHPFLNLQFCSFLNFHFFQDQILFCSIILKITNCPLLNNNLTILTLL